APHRCCARSAHAAEIGCGDLQSIEASLAVGTKTITAPRLRRLIAGQRRTRSAALFKAKAG
ncbi:MAG: hypothetical protein WCA43_02175, partial [Bradyrhizobium sp.]